MKELICPKCRKLIIWIGDEQGDEGEVYSVYGCQRCNIEVYDFSMISLAKKGLNVK